MKKETWGKRFFIIPSFHSQLEFFIALDDETQVTAKTAAITCWHLLFSLLLFSEHLPFLSFISFSLLLRYSLLLVKWQREDDHRKWWRTWDKIVPPAVAPAPDDDSTSIRFFIRINRKQRRKIKFGSRKTCLFPHLLRFIFLSIFIIFFFLFSLLLFCTIWHNSKNNNRSSSSYIFFFLSIGSIILRRHLVTQINNQPPAGTEIWQRRHN